MDIIYVNKEEFINDNIRIVQTDKKDNIHFYSINYQYDDKLLSYLNILINSLPLCNKRYGAYQYSDKSAHLPLNTETDVYMSVMSFIQKIRDYVIDKIMINYTGDHVFDPEYISSLKAKKIKIEIMHKGKLCKIRKLVPKNDKYESIKTINDINTEVSLEPQDVLSISISISISINISIITLSAPCKTLTTDGLVKI